MRVRYGVALLVLTAVGCTERWETFAPREAGFIVSMPGPPEVRARDVSTPEGRVREHLATVRVGRSFPLGSPKAFFSVSYFRVDQPVVSPGEMDRVFQESIDRSLAAGGANYSTRLVSNQPIVYKGHAGREVRFESKYGQSSAACLTRMFVAGEWFVALSVVTGQPESYTDDRTRFFDSLKFREPGTTTTR